MQKTRAHLLWNDSVCTNRRSNLIISNHTLAAFAAFVIGAANTNLPAASFSDANWSNVGSVLNAGPLPRPSESVGGVATDSSGNLYVGGEFTISGGVLATNIAKWNGSSWSALGSGVNGNVVALLAVGNELYAGGQFTMAGGVPTTNIAKWNGSHWSALGAGVGLSSLHSGYVSSLVMSGGHLYAGGSFTNASGVPANHVAKWNGSSWSALGGGFGNVVQALAVSGSNVYAGGHFTTAGGITANYIAMWNGESWSALGSGMNNTVYSLAVLGSNIYAGGYFTRAGGISATNIAQWDGSAWSAVGAGIRSLDNQPFHLGNVTALAVSGNDLYAAGNFWYNEEWSELNRIAKWNGSTWGSLGSERYSSFVSSMAVSSTVLYAGLSGEVTASVFKARIGSNVRSVVVTDSTVTLQFSGVTGYEYDVQRTTNLNSPIWMTINTNPLSPAADGSFTFTDTNTPPGNAFYRANLSAPTP